LLWEKGRTIARFAYRYRADAFDASPRGPEVGVGPHRLLPGAGGTLALTIAEVPSAAGANRVSGELWFTPKLAVAPAARRFPSREAAGADHFWVIADPLCAVSGIVRITDPFSSPSLREVHFAGRGYHDHRHGSGPLYATNDIRWIRGRVLFDDHADVFQYFEQGPQGSYFRADSSGIRDVTPDDWQPDRDGLQQLELQGGLVLQSPQEVASNPFALTFTYDAMRSGKRQGTALCEVARLRSGLASRRGDFEDAP
jgi:hypothetical protein